jgi:hypothetical protein
MRTRTAVATVAALLATAAPAGAEGDPIMPLSQVRQGMRCTAYSVVRGTEVTSFEAEVVDVVGGDSGSRILVKVSGPAVDSTGVGAGFSGSPIYCPDDQGTARNIGAISETIGDYGGKTVLATPIEAILAANPDPVPAAGASRRTLASPITVRGLSRPVFRALAGQARRQGRVLLEAPPRSIASQAPPASFKPGSAVGIGLSSGDVAIGAIGTVAYVDGPKVWTLGHEFDGVGSRALLLQTAYVATVINNPVQLADAGGTYKLAGAVADVGTVNDDTFNAVAGRLGGLPVTVPVAVFAKDEGSRRTLAVNTRVADETAVGNPSGTSPLGFVGPVAVAQAASVMYNSTPTKLSGTMCLRISLRELPKPARICNRYVSDGTGAASTAGNLVAAKAAADASEALGLVDSYKPAALHVTGMSATVAMRRGQHQAFMRRLQVPRRARPGQRIRVRLGVQLVRGERRTLSFSMRAPRQLGDRTITLRGTEADAPDDLFGGLTIDLGGSDTPSDPTGPRTVDDLVTEIKALERYDGVRGSGGVKVFRDEDLRIGGRISAPIRITHRG